MRNLICLLKGHKWKYNFPIRSMPNKAICVRCSRKHLFDLHNLEWNEVAEFEKETRTDKELKEQWV